MKPSILYPSHGSNGSVLCRSRSRKEQMASKKGKKCRNFMFWSWSSKTSIRIHQKDWIWIWWILRRSLYWADQRLPERLPERRTAPASRRVSTLCTLAGGRGMPLRTYWSTAHQSEYSSRHLSSYLISITLLNLYIQLMQLFRLSKLYNITYRPKAIVCIGSVS
jgi:hypothetical protein